MLLPCKIFSKSLSVEVRTPKGLFVIVGSPVTDDSLDISMLLKLFL